MAEVTVAGTEQAAQATAVAEPAGATPDGDLLVIEELLVEEISIDGMCGVY
jgi:mycofactocin precursor